MRVRIKIEAGTTNPLPQNIRIQKKKEFTLRLKIR